MKKKYRALRILTWIFRSMAVLLFLGGVGLGVFFAVTPLPVLEYDSAGKIQVTQGVPATGAGIGLIVGSVLIGLSLFAFGELLHLMIDLEENTRKSTFLLQRLTKDRIGE